MNNKKVMPTTEIVGAILQTHAEDLDLASFKSSPSAFLQDQGVALADVDIAVVENESSVVHLCLPYYDGMDSIGSGFIEDTDLESITGGELIVIGVISGVGAVVVGALAIAGFTIAGVAENHSPDENDDGLNQDGSSK